MADSIRYDLSLSGRLMRALPSLLVYGTLIGVLISLVPPRVFEGGTGLAAKGAITVGFIGAWRYLWQLTHIIRAAIYEHFKYPRMRFVADQLPEDQRHPGRLFFVIATYKEIPKVSRRMIASVLKECRTIPSDVTIVISSGSEEEDKIFTDYLAEHPASANVHMRYIRQVGGKRAGMAEVLHQLMEEKISDDDMLVLMDGDTVLGPDILTKCAPLFMSRPKLGAITTDNISVTQGNFLYRKWYTLRFSMRHRMMKSQSFSNRLLVLTGRFSVFRAKHVLDEAFIGSLENDRIRHWLHGEIKFLTGDDKSTWFCLLKKGVEMLYVPDAHILCLEHSGAKPMRESISKMHRWFGNMLRNNTRAIAVGVGPQPFFNWWCLIDQRISMWTSLIGPATAIWISIFVTPWAAVLYAVTVIFLRAVYLILLAIEGHRVSLWDIPMILYTHWVGSIVKIYTLFHLHTQKWESRQSDSDSNEPKIPLTERLIPKMQIALSTAIFILAIAVVIGTK